MLLLSGILIACVLFLLLEKVVECFSNKNILSVNINGKVEHFDLDKMSVEEIRDLRKKLVKKYKKNSIL